MRLYRDSWNQTVAARRSSAVGNEVDLRVRGDDDDPVLATALVEIEREAENWVSLARLYQSIGNTELRDKAIDRAVEQGVSNDTLVMLRRMQGRLAEVPADVITAELERLSDDTHYRSLALLQEDLGWY